MPAQALLRQFRRLEIMRILASTTLLAALLGCVLSATPALSQQAPASGHSAHEMPASGNPVIDEFRSANEKMHKDMGIALSGDADRDFAQSMIPHHQGAIDMARIALKHGKDPEIRKLAEAVVSAQESEIAQLKEWLARHPR
jgi:uncharacterized protein (DUF305 family)